MQKLVASVAACAIVPTLAWAQSPIAPSVMDRAGAIDAFYQFIIQKADGTTVRSGEWAGQSAAYSSKKDPKALVACLSWRETTPTSFPGRYWLRTGSSANPPASPTAAVSEATEFCVKSGCARDACVLVDLNGHNALQPPADWPGATVQRSEPATAVAQAPAVAQMPGVAAKDVFEKYGLLGTFAWDCSKPPSRDNLYYVNRAIDGGAVQRDEMSGPSTRDHLTIIDKAAALGPNEISTGGTRDGQTIDSIWRVETNRQIAVEVTLGGRKVISGGRLGGREVPWTNKCPAGDTTAQSPRPVEAAAAPTPGGSVKTVFERYGLLGTFAWDCSKPASEDNNWYYVNRAIDDGHVQRDFMVGPNTRKWASIIHTATPLGPNEVFLGATVDGRTSNGVWRVDGTRMLQWKADLDGQTVIEGGKLVRTGRDMPWLNKCGAP